MPVFTVMPAAFEEAVMGFDRDDFPDDDAMRTHAEMWVEICAEGKRVDIEKAMDDMTTSGEFEELVAWLVTWRNESA